MRKQELGSVYKDKKRPLTVDGGLTGEMSKVDLSDRATVADRELFLNLVIISDRLHKFDFSLWPFMFKRKKSLFCWNLPKLDK